MKCLHLQLTDSRALTKDAIRHAGEVELALPLDPEASMKIHLPCHSGFNPFQFAMQAVPKSDAFRSEVV